MVEIEDLKRRIKEQTIEPPKGFTADELLDWLSGYSACMKDVMSILKSFA